MKVARIIRKSLKFEPPEYLNPFLIIFPSGVYLRSLLTKFHGNILVLVKK